MQSLYLFEELFMVAKMKSKSYAHVKSTRLLINV